MWQGQKASSLWWDCPVCQTGIWDEGRCSAEAQIQVQKSESDADTGGGLMLAALGEHFAKMETSALDPTQANMAQILKNLFQEKV